MYLIPIISSTEIITSVIEIEIGWNAHATAWL